jgi:hypothetical protein
LRPDWTREHSRDWDRDRDKRGTFILGLQGVMLYIYGLPTRFTRVHHGISYICTTYSDVLERTLKF